jgi:hypothetical protein
VFEPVIRRRQGRVKIVWERGGQLLEDVANLSQIGVGRGRIAEAVVDVRALPEAGRRGASDR